MKRALWQFNLKHLFLLLANFFVVPSSMAEDELSIKLSYEQARQILQQKSDAIEAANHQVSSELDYRKSLDRLKLPTLSISAGVMAYDSERELDIEPLQQAIGQVIPGANQLIPSSLGIDLNAVNPTAALTSSWLLYTGGQTDAAQRFADAGIALAEAERKGTYEQQEKLLATLYFGQLLAGRVLAIREEVLHGVEQHLHLAKRFEEKGILSKVERLHAQVAYDEANRNYIQARADFGIADMALRRLLRSEASVKPQTGLFVLSKSLEPVDRFINAALEGHSQLAQIRAKHKQAEQGKVIEEARWKPSVVAYGTYNLAQEDADFSNPLPLLEPDWVVGVNVSYPLFDRYNRNRLISAAEQKIQRVDALERELKTGLVTLIEKSYRSTERSREQFVLLESNIELAQETLQLRERLFEEGLGTSLDVVDARLAAARAETERAVAAYAFVISLVDLLDASGQLERFNEYVKLADIRLAVRESKQ